MLTLACIVDGCFEGGLHQRSGATFLSSHLYTQALASYPPMVHHTQVRIVLKQRPRTWWANSCLGSLGTPETGAGLSDCS